MKPILFIAALAVSIAASAVLAESNHQGPSHGSMAMDHATGETPANPMSEGTVKKVDRAAAKLTIAHGPLANLGMPGMTMVFRTKDPAMLAQVKEGDRIRFIADRVGGAFTVITLESAN